jgi:hypothetical protein
MNKTQDLRGAAGRSATVLLILHPSAFILQARSGQ